MLTRVDVEVLKDLWKYDKTELLRNLFKREFQIPNSFENTLLDIGFIDMGFMNEILNEIEPHIKNIMKQLEKIKDDTN